jgi:hypothetical protein
MSKIAIAAATAAALALSAFQATAHIRYDRYDRTFQLVNNSNRTVYSVYATDVGTTTWRNDLLGRDVIDPGRSMIVEPQQNRGYCRYDVRIVFDYDGGPSQTIRNVNLCELRQLVTNGNDRGRAPYILTYL